MQRQPMTIEDFDARALKVNDLFNDTTFEYWLWSQHLSQDPVGYRNTWDCTPVGKFAYHLWQQLTGDTDHGAFMLCGDVDEDFYDDEPSACPVVDLRRHIEVSSGWGAFGVNLTPLMIRFTNEVDAIDERCGEGGPTGPVTAADCLRIWQQLQEEVR